MTYLVKQRFFDILDNNYLYEKGDVYPRKDYEPTKDRLNDLLSDNNPTGTVFIAKDKEEALEDLTVPELKAKAEAKGIEIPAKAKKDDIVQLILNPD